MHWYIATLFWLHLLGIVLWIGASFVIPLILWPSARVLDPAARSRFMGEFSRRLRTPTVVAILLVVATGVLQTGSLYGLPAMVFHRVLATKILIALLMIANGGYIGFGLGPAIARLAPAPDSPPSPEFLRKQASLVRHSWIQAGMGVVVLFVTGLLTVPAA